MSDEEGGPTRAERFGEYVSRAALEAGFDINSRRGGGKKALAEAAGMSAASVSRMLAGQTIPEPVYLERLAFVLGVSLPELLVRSGIVSARSAISPSGEGASVRQEPLSPEEAARRAGVRNPQHIAVIATMIETFVEQEAASTRRGRPPTTKGLHEADQQYLRTTKELNVRRAG